MMESGIRSLALGDVHIWWARQDCALADGFSVLDAAERALHARFHHAQDRDLYRLAHGLLRHALSAYAPIAPADWRFMRKSHGKPALTPDLATSTCLTFSLSHRAGTAAVAIGRSVRLGIDIEPLDQKIDPDALARDVLHPDEIAELAGLEDQAKRRAFIALWTLKEAYVKGLGLGLSYPLTDCAFAIDPAKRTVSARLDAGLGAWRFQHRVIEERDALSIACESLNERANILFCGPWV